VPARSVDDAIREVRTVLQTGEVHNYADEVYHNVKQLQRNSRQRTHA
jgi:DNA polymerase II small subunit/DNA polymerase delta subunit B